MPDTSITATSNIVTPSNVDCSSTAAGNEELPGPQVTTLGKITHNGRDQVLASLAGSASFSGSSTVSSTSSSLCARESGSSALPQCEVVIFSTQDDAFTYTMGNQLQDSISREKKWTHGMTWTCPSISSRTFQVETQICLEVFDKEDGTTLQVFLPSQIYDIDMPWKVYVGRNASPTERKFEKIFICKETPELYW